MANQIIICGQDIVLDLLANRLNQCIGENVFRSYKGSYNGLYAMYQGEVNVATAHLWHGKTNSYNIPYISSMLPGTDLVVLHLLKRKQGFYCLLYTSVLSCTPEYSGVISEPIPS